MEDTEVIRRLQLILAETNPERQRDLYHDLVTGPVAQRVVESIFELSQLGLTPTDRQ